MHIFNFISCLCWGPLAAEKPLLWPELSQQVSHSIFLYFNRRQLLLCFIEFLSLLYFETMAYSSQETTFDRCLRVRSLPIQFRASLVLRATFFLSFYWPHSNYCSSTDWSQSAHWRRESFKLTKLCSKLQLRMIPEAKFSPSFVYISYFSTLSRAPIEEPIHSFPL